MIRFLLPVLLLFLAACQLPKDGADCQGKADCADSATAASLAGSGDCASKKECDGSGEGVTQASLQGDCEGADEACAMKAAGVCDGTEKECPMEAAGNTECSSKAAAGATQVDLTEKGECSSKAKEECSSEAKKDCGSKEAPASVETGATQASQVVAEEVPPCCASKNENPAS